MNFDNLSIGVDIEKISRFNKDSEKDVKFLNMIYTQKELEYCYSKKSFSQHLAARYCGKEAIVKALYGFGIKDVYYKDIEIINNSDGVPIAKIEKYPHIKVKISLSHNKDTAVAYVIIENINK